MGSSVDGNDRMDGVSLLSVGVDLDNVCRGVRYCYLVHRCGVELLIRIYRYVYCVVCFVSCDRKRVLVHGFVVEDW